MCQILIYCCISLMLAVLANGAPLNNTNSTLLQIIIDDVLKLKAITTINDDFYLPKDTKNCSLMCYLKEMHSLRTGINMVMETQKEEFTDTISRIDRNLNNLLKKGTSTETECKPCESHTAGNSKDLLDALITFLQSMYAKSP